MFSQHHIKMILCLVVVLGLVASTLSQDQCQTDRLNAVKNGEQPVRGVNLGSWVVLESWMAPAPWEESGCDRGTQGGTYLLEQCLGDRAPEIMGRHWSTWITEDDFADMSRRGINVARLPVGWWQIYDTQGGVTNANLNYNVDPRNYTAGGLEFIDKAFDLGLRYGIAIIIDMHAAPGSQNGNDHSSPAQWPGQILWDKFDDNIGQTVDSIGLYAERFANHPALFGIALLNEPDHIDMTKLQNYYLNAYERVRQYSADSWIIVNPLINPFESGTEDHWIDFMNENQGFNKIALDLHYYSCFGGPPDQSNPDGAIDYIRTERQNQINEFAALNSKKMMIGEWSSCAHFNGDDRFAEFTQAQVDVYGTASLGFTFWSWKVVDNVDTNLWSLKDIFNNGWMQPQYPCN